MPQINQRVFNVWIIVHKSFPVTNDIQLVEFSVSYLMLVIVLIIPKGKSNTPKIKIPTKAKKNIFRFRRLFIIINILIRS